jgi:hypothetical protein
MKTKLILSALAATICLLITLTVSSEPYEFTGKMMNNTGLESTKYIAVDQNRVVNNAAKAQPVNTSEKEIIKSNYNIDIENWKDAGVSANALAPTRDAREFGLGMGVDRDLIRQYDGSSTGGLDAREVHNFKEDVRY